VAGAVPISDEYQIREAVAGVDDDAVTALMVEYLTWAHERLREEYGVDEPPTDPGEQRSKLAEYRPPAGVQLVVDCGGEVAGVGALRWLADAVAEVKRMYVPDRWRGAHLGSAILDRLIDQAAAAGATAVRLDTVRFMTDAQRLYRSRGFANALPTRRPRSLRGCVSTGCSSSAVSDPA
jgi:GNAT superfamily N-acetyltransferase